MMGAHDFDRFRSTLEELQGRWTEEDERDKVSSRATIHLAEVYRAADANARQMFDRVLADWVRAREPGQWFDAQALIREFSICSALPAVREALGRWRNEL